MRRILIVDDEPLIRLGLSFQIGDWGFEGLEASSAEEAIQILETTPAIRLILTDVDMPGSMDGIRLAAYVRDRWPPVAILVMSGKVTAQGVLPAGSRFLHKPLDDAALRAVLDELTR